MPPLLQSPLATEHAQELLRLERDELQRLFGIYEQARLELLGRLSSLPGERFSAQQVRVALSQVEMGLRAMLERLGDDKAKHLGNQLEGSVSRTLETIRHYEPGFRGAQGRIQTAALRKLATPEKLLLHQYDVSMRTYGGQLVGEMQRRLAVHAVKKSTIREMSVDLAGRLERHAMTGARWRAERIARTELMDALTTAQVAGIETAATVVEGLQQQFNATLDTRTTHICRDLNGRVRPLGKPFGEYRGRAIYRPPVLPHCRSGVQPYHPRWQEEEEAERKVTPVGQPVPTPAERRTEPVRARERRADQAQAQRQAIREAENSIRGQRDFETAVVIDPRGETVFRKDGQARSVAFTPRELGKLPGNVLTRNHPSGRSLSVPDVQLAAQWNLAEMRAVGARPLDGVLYEYSLKPPRQGWGGRFWIDVLEPVVTRIHQELQTEIWARIRAGELSREEADALHGHLLWRRVAKQTGVKYSRRAVRT